MKMGSLVMAAEQSQADGPAAEYGVRQAFRAGLRAFDAMEQQENQRQPDRAVQHLRPADRADVAAAGEGDAPKIDA